jgi:hypothetical protein
VGGDGPTVLDRVLSFGDVWLPNYHDPDRLYERKAELQSRADRRIDVQAIGLPADPKHLERAEQEGLTRAVHWLPSAGRGPVERALERWENAILEFTGG